MQGFHELTLPDGQPLVNEYDCHSWTYLPLSSVLLATIYNDLCLLFIAYSRRLGHQSGMLSVTLFRRTHLYLSMTGTTLCIVIMSIIHFNNRFLIMAMMLSTKYMNTIVSNSYQQVLIWETAFLVQYVISLFQIRHHID